MTERTKFPILVWAAVIGACFLVAGAIAAIEPEQAKPVAAERQGDIAREVAIMARILEKRLGDELEGEVLTASMFQRGVQGFHVPGVGALFFVDVKFPLAEPAKSEQEPERDRDDLWDRFEHGIKTGPIVIEGDAERGVFRYGKREIDVVTKSERVDKKKVDRVKSTLFEVLARYGRRIESLRDDEKIIVLVNGNPGGDRLVTYTSSVPSDATSALAYYLVEETGKPGVSAYTAIARTEALEQRDAAAKALDAAKQQLEEKDERTEREPEGEVHKNAQTEKEEIQQKLDEAERDRDRAKRAAEDMRRQVERAKSDVIRTRTRGERRLSDGKTVLGLRPGSVQLGGPFARDRGSALVIVVSKKDLVDDPDDLAKRATVETYCY